MVVAEYWKADYLFWVFPAMIAAGLLSGIGLLLILLSIKFYARYTCGMYKRKTKMDGKMVIITGCNSGIGKETAKDLAMRGARVIMACRNIEMAEKVKDEIIDITNNKNVIVKKLDLSSFASIRAFAQDINTTEPRLDVLIHNAGYADLLKKRKSADDIELTLATNHYGPFLLTHLLIKLLKKSSPSRIVVVASSLYRLGYFNINNPNPVNDFSGYQYYVSKEANILFTKELSRRLEGTGVTVNCLHPGLIDTGIWNSIPRPLSWFWNLVIKGFFKTPTEGCQTTVMLAVDEDLLKTTGKYFSDCQESSVSNTASDMKRAKKLWEISEKMVKLDENDPRI
ncbi:PREDICTED: retinol dehydrogenase 11-like [Papilio xuthus]|uniref:Retinol dehydrogenase 11-like n=1 Tax=Papilio xuthus TaxID=66420 RepID=A0AAJ6ZKN0_PAPXU|nr:PREDICTED: retinol dehydrogenase 11-like [Papilio xuthus]